GAFWLDVDAGVADAFFKRMKMYRLRAAVEIADLRETHAVGWDGSAPHTRAIGTKAESAQWDMADSSYDAARIARGIAEQGPDFAPDTMFPHDVGMDLLGGGGVGLVAWWWAGWGAGCGRRGSGAAARGCGSVNVSAIAPPSYVLGHF